MSDKIKKIANIESGSGRYSGKYATSYFWYDLRKKQEEAAVSKNNTNDSEFKKLFQNAISDIDSCDYPDQKSLCDGCCDHKASVFSHSSKHWDISHTCKNGAYKNSNELPVIFECDFNKEN